MYFYFNLLDYVNFLVFFNSIEFFSSFDSLDFISLFNYRLFIYTDSFHEHSEFFYEQNIGDKDILFYLSLFRDFNINNFYFNNFYSYSFDLVYFSVYYEKILYNLIFVENFIPLYTNKIFFWNILDLFFNSLSFNYFNFKKIYFDNVEFLFNISNIFFLKIDFSCNNFFFIESIFYHSVPYILYIGFKPMFFFDFFSYIYV